MTKSSLESSGCFRSLAASCHHASKSTTKYNLKQAAEATVENPELVEEMGRGILQSVLGDQAFSITDSDLSRIENVSSLLELSIEFEKHTILFYQMLRSFIDDREILNGLDKIIEEESRQVEELSFSVTPMFR
jgi:rubrerythrin